MRAARSSMSQPTPSSNRTWLVPCCAFPFPHFHRRHRTESLRRRYLGRAGAASNMRLLKGARAGANVMVVDLQLDPIAHEDDVAHPLDGPPTPRRAGAISVVCRSRGHAPGHGETIVAKPVLAGWDQFEVRIVVQAALEVLPDGGPPTIIPPDR